MSTIPVITSFIASLRTRQKAVWIATVLIASLAILLTLVLIVIWVERFFWLEPAVRQGLVEGTRYFLIFLVAGNALFGITLFLLKKHPTDSSLARRIWHLDSQVRDRILNSLQLSSGDRFHGSEKLRLEALRWGEELVKNLAVSDYLLKGGFQRAGRFLLYSAILVVFSGLINGKALYQAGNRLTHPHQQFIKPGTVLLALDMPDTLRVIQGESLELRAHAQLTVPRQVTFYITEPSGVERELIAVQDTADAMLFTAHVEKVERDARILARSRKAESNSVLLEVIPRPRISRLNVSVRPPGYAGLSDQHLKEGVGDILALPGSRVSVNVESNRELSTATLFFQKKNSQPDSILLEVRDRSAKGGFRITSNESWWIRMTALDGVESDQPIEWKVSLLEDYPPSIDIRLPEDGSEIPQHLTLPLVAVIDDDYGISRVSLRYMIYNELTTPDSVDESAFMELPLDGERPENGRLVIKTLWSLQGLPLLPTDEVHYFIEAWDNNTWAGFQRTRSPMRRLIFPSMKDLFEETSEEEIAVEDQMKESLKDAEKIKEKFEESLERLKSNPEDLSWEENQSLQQSVDSQEDVMKQLEKAAEMLENLQQQFEEHDLTTTEMLEKYNKLQDLLNEMMTPEMKKAMEDLQDALKEEDGEKIREALEDLLADQKSFIESLDRSLSILEQLKNERKLEELTKRAEDLARREKDLQEELAGKDEKNQRALEFEQNAISEETKSLLEEMKKTADALPENRKDIANDLDSLRNSMSDPDLNQELAQTNQQIQNGEFSDASQSAEQNSKRLQQMADQLGAMSDQMKSQSKEELEQEMDQLFEQLLILSRHQETVRQQSVTLGISSPRYRSLAASQNSLLDGLAVAMAEVAEISKKTFFVGAQIAGELSLAKRRMQGAIERYTARRPREVSGEQRQAMAAIHRSLLKLNQAKEEMQQSSSSTGYEEMMEKLSQMAQQQQGINQGSQGMPMPMPGQSQTPGAGQMGQLQKMAARQRALAEAMGQLEQQAQSMENLLGSLDGLGKSMEEVAKDLDENNVNERTKRLQKRILQRLLDAQRSMQRRELSRERKSNTGIDIRRISPSQLTPEEFSILQQYMKKALESDFNDSWKPVIREYYKSLEKELHKETAQP